MELLDQVRAIDSRADFIEFVHALRRDFATNPESWENRDLDSFLEALAAWVEGMDGYYRNVGVAPPEQPTWKVLGDIFMAATMYE
jgi:hypothetical protein